MSFTHCKHWNGRDLFNGSTGGKCRAGVDPVYSFCGGDRFGWVRKVPCVRPNETDVVCPAADYPTQEEAQAKAAEFEAYVDRFLTIIGKVRPAIDAEHKASGAWSGALDCPQCNKPLHWSKSRYNGHVRGACETEECVSWME